MSSWENSASPILIIAHSDAQAPSARSRAAQLIGEELRPYGHPFIFVSGSEEANAIVRTETGFACVIVDWHVTNADHPEESAAPSLIAEIRKRDATVPIILAAQRASLSSLPLSVLKEVREYIHLGEDTPAFIAGRIQFAIKQHAASLLPPYYKALKSYAEDRPYYWDCPGHQGGVAYLKHPVGRDFLNFFGENIMRADIGIATPEMGDWLEHMGPPGESERRAAKTFGADMTFYVTGGSSQSNQIVGHGVLSPDQIVLADRNCHKSVNHELVVTRTRPVYFKPARNGLGIIGLIPPEQFSPKAIKQAVRASKLAPGAVAQEPAYAIVTNCTYDGLIYNVDRITEELAHSVPRIKFDEAWYAYAKFHPLYRGRFAMGVPDDMPNRPTLFAVQSTHKMLAAFSSASMIHIRNSERAPVDHHIFNQSFAMHGTTSPFYPIIASIDVAGC